MGLQRHPRGLRLPHLHLARFVADVGVEEYSRLALPYYIQHKKSTVVNQMDSRVGPQIYETINFLV